MIRIVPDFPKAGVSFKDVSPLFEKKFTETVEALSQLIQWDQVEQIAGIEARGFILGAALAQKHNKGFIPVRKKGKLPAPTISKSYELEYGQDTLEISKLHAPAKTVIVDDVIATGGTLKATIELCSEANLEVTNCLALINLSFLNELDKDHNHIKALFRY